ncbi:molybdopterin-dependent oxidoreductase [Halarsenatibacter silvermanii]|uniref:CO or xanthine dehydrogenase, Mo-binding subunit n=1 Tax=Halarsenatibacter silvermanii TaxID=321763 RepID=A0A1G9IA93_9FIRM|nr:molybdopterin cofactor-binding domain-containing protein [Halarsenatibacter silvermanii]SDL22178.1 CO or xanthine dehydrogenase, Mo-binding subunit [Halarsenatibacter silvermanii]
MEEGNMVINGETIKIAEGDDRTLLEFLRREKGLMGTKDGCHEGHCGTCTVIVDGRARKSCLVSVRDLDGAEIETIEGLAGEGKLHPIQRAFLEEGAVQCGFCTPGMIMSAKALLDENPDPSREEIKKALNQNICRCTGYSKIIAAVSRAAAVLRGETKFSSAPGMNSPVGERFSGEQEAAKVTGEPIYVDDIDDRDEMLYGAFTLSSEPHAEIESIDVFRAENAEGVVEVLTGEDLPGKNYFGLIEEHQPVLALEKVRFVGDPVALVVAENPAAADRASEMVAVDYNPLPVHDDPQKALEPEAEDIHEGGNLLKKYELRKGDWQDPLAGADVVVEGEYKTPFIEHAYLEPEGVLSEYDEEGKLVVHSPSQSSHAYQEFIADALDLPKEEVRVKLTQTGGAFGGREEPLGQIHSALAAYVTGRPVKIVLSRRESIRMSTKRHAARLRYRTGATEDGELVGAEIEIYSNTGAYASLGEPVSLRHTSFSCGPYEVPHVKVDTYSVYTNSPPGGAMRGFGSPQVCFAAERQMEKLAEKLEMDPFELRRKNILQEGSPTITGDILEEGGIGLEKCLTAVEERLKELEIPESDSPNKEIGTGIAAGYKNVGTGNGLPEELEVRAVLGEDGYITLYVGSVDSGQGLDTALTQIAAEALGCRPEDFRVVASDTELTFDAGVTTASRMVFREGNALKKCMDRLSGRIKKSASDLLNKDAGELEITGGGIAAVKSGEKLLDFADIFVETGEVSACYRYNPPQTDPLPEEEIPAYPEPEERKRLHYAYCFGVHAAVVEVDRERGSVEVLKVLAAHDVGRAINPQNVEGQIEGGAVMGLGYALKEEFSVEEGWPVQDNLARLRLPRALDAPDIEPIIVEDFHPDGPFGAKGMGELPNTPTAPAICNAVKDAVGLDVKDLPVSRSSLRK